MQPQFIARLSAKLIVAAFMLLLGVAAPASAATITATFTGTVKTGFDQVGVFGTAGADLAGAAYELVFTVDPAVGAYSTYNGTIVDPLLSGDQIFGGKSASLTINGHSYSFPGTGSPTSNFNLFGSKPGFGFIVYQTNSIQPPNFDGSQVLVSLSTTIPGAGFPTSVLSAVAINSCPAGSCTFGATFDIPGGQSGYFHGSLNFGSFTLGTVATTPIPAALPLLVSALGGLGFAGWRRKRAA
jgi:hypothetical protein